MNLSHLNSAGDASMVDVSSKTSTARIAVAEAFVRFPADIYDQVKTGQSKKGAICTVAHVAGVMAAKKTAELIPLCHPLMLEKCELTFDFLTNKPVLHITATVGINHKTGVEMEALTAVAVAALTVYDMCKALSHHIVIDHIQLVSKVGGKSDV